MAFSLKHLSQSHIMPRTRPVDVIIFAACIGFPQHCGTFRLTTAFLVAAFAVLLISAMAVHLHYKFRETPHFTRMAKKVKLILAVNNPLICCRDVDPCRSGEGRQTPSGTPLLKF
jgi:hypothetical protein